MKRRHTLRDFNSVDYIELKQKTAIHEAGHAAAIYFGNRQKQLPPVFFQIILGDCLHGPTENCLTKVEGGRLIQTLPPSIDQVINDFTPEQKRAYQQAFEADIINLLVGGLAEANYVAQRDNEIINPVLLPIDALHNYGGSSDLEIIEEYLDSFIANRDEQQKKISELYCAAFEFINDWAYWYSITALANYILSNDKSIIDYEEVATILDANFAVATKCAWYYRYPV